MKKQQLYHSGDLVRLKSGKLAKVRSLLWAAGTLFYYDVRVNGGGMIYPEGALTPA